jgi:hypothetical protein
MEWMLQVRIGDVLKEILYADQCVEPQVLAMAGRRRTARTGEAARETADARS